MDVIRFIKDIINKIAGKYLLPQHHIIVGITGQDIIQRRAIQAVQHFQFCSRISPISEESNLFYRQNDYRKEQKGYEVWMKHSFGYTERKHETIIIFIREKGKDWWDSLQNQGINE